MPNFVIMVCYPSHKQSEFMTKYASLGTKYKMEGLMKILSWSANTTLEGVKILGVYEALEGKFLEALTLLQKLCYEFKDIEGLEYKIETWINAAEAMNLAQSK
ncbi:MAG: hypothetical protein ACFFCS_03525 [Candidatus Hodarchaeota archaeon]